MSAAGDATRRKTACVTGGNGYIGSALVKMLLERGYAVKTTVRDPDDMEKNSHLKALQALGPLEVFRADLGDEGSFDAAVAGCDCAFLVAAPVNLKAENPEKDMVEPAVEGTLNVMRSCVRAGTVKRVILTSSVAAVSRRQRDLIEAGVQGTLNVMRSCVRAGTVKRVVLTSSAAAVSSRPLEGDGHVLDEESWSDVDWLRSSTTGHWAYPVSKVLLEKAACAFAQESGISLVTVCPVVVVGAAPAVKVHTSVPDVLSPLSGDEEKIRILQLIEKASGSVPLVHIDDLCRAELFLAEKEAASARYICCSLNTTAAELARFLAVKYPQYNVKTDRFSGDLPEKPRVCISSAKLVGEGFEYKYKTLDEIYDGVVEYGRTLGILPY
uniref:Uncharacterized protein n=1 Tax=Avena sativa TaxID=4498 RepID=A0ACD5UU32_AVESA